MLNHVSHSGASITVLYETHSEFLTQSCLQINLKKKKKILIFPFISNQISLSFVSNFECTLNKTGGLELQNPNRASEYYLKKLAPINVLCSIIQNENLFLILITDSKSIKLRELQFDTTLN